MTLMVTAVQAQWKQAVSGGYATASNWAGGVIPTFSASPLAEYDVTLGGVGTLGSSAFTVTSGTNKQVGMLTVNANATFVTSAGVFTVDSQLTPWSYAYNLGTITVAVGSALAFGAAGSAAYYTSELWNTGAVTIAGTLDLFAPTFALVGGGAFTLSGGSILGAATGAGNAFVNLASTITGSGVIGNGAAASGGAGLHLVNHAGATINANAASALVLNTGSNTIQNAGVIKTTGAGGLKIASAMAQDGSLIAGGKGALTIAGALVSGGGTDSVLSGGSIVLNNGEIGDGGTVSIAAGGALNTTAGDTTGVGAASTFAGDVLSSPDVENNGAITVVDNSTLNVSASVFGSGKINVSGQTKATKLEIFGAGASFHATGGIVLSNSAYNSIVANGAGQQLSNYATISGAGTIGDGFLRLFNAPTGVVNANAATGLAIVGDAAAVSAGSESANYNAGVIETTGAGGLTIGGQLGNGGVIEAVGAGALTLNGVQINNGGGVVETVGTGHIVLKGNVQINHQADVQISAGGALSTSAGDVSDTIDANVFNAGTIAVVDGSTLFADDHWLNSGAVNLSGKSVLEVSAASTLFLSGGGHVNLKSSQAAILSGGASAYFDNIDNLIVGSGVIGDSNMRIGNASAGVIDATGAMTITASGQIYNAGSIVSDTAAGLTIATGLYNPGSLVVDSGDKLIAQKAVQGAGTTTINGTGSVEFGGENDTDVTFAAGGAGSLILDASAQDYGRIWGFANGDTIDLRDFAYVAGSTQLITGPSAGFTPFDGALMLSNGSAFSAPVYLEGDYMASYLSANHLAFKFSSDGHAGTNITLVPV